MSDFRGFSPTEIGQEDHDDAVAADAGMSPLVF